MERKARINIYIFSLVLCSLLGSRFHSFGSLLKDNRALAVFSPDPPVVNPATSVTTSGFDASWSTVAGAIEYRLDVSTSPSFSSFIAGYNDLSVASTTQSVSGLVAGQTYYFRVRSNDGIGFSVNSNTEFITTQTDPPFLTDPTYITSTSFRLNWILSNGATGYELDLATDAGFSDLVLSAQPVSATYYDVAGMTAGTTYFYRVRAITSGGNSSNSSEESLTTIPEAPLAVAATAINSTGFTANWNTVTGATEYRLDLSLYPSFSSFIPGYTDYSIAANSLAIVGLVEGQTYYYRIRAMNNGGSSDNSNSITTTTIPVAPTANSATSILGTGFTANWSNVSGSTEYRIDVANNSSFSPNLASYSNRQVLSNSLSVSGLTSTTTYYYRVRALSSGGASDNSNIIIVPGAPVASSGSGATTSSFVANWNSVTDATEYRLDVSTDAAFSNILSSYNNLSVLSENQTVSGLSAGKIYYYRVRAVSSGGTSINSNSINISTVPDAPTAAAATSISPDQFTANWGSTIGASSYRVDVATDVAFSSLILNDVSVAGTSTAVTGLDPGQTYYYRVRAVNSGGASASSNTISLNTTPEAPVANDATGIATTQFTAVWDAVPGANDYLLDVSTNSGFTSFLSGYNGFVTTSTNRTISSLLAGTTYYYRVRARNTGGIGDYSNDITAVTIATAPVATAATSVSKNSFIANWNSSAGATSYKLDVAVDNT
ncbi:MAG TPA: fibronectin type III domain-containing protein, partial [Cytophagales bacterium]|nr:fibronectin type III domain-containing protein [Cytophagales bacterium]